MGHEPQAVEWIKLLIALIVASTTFITALTVLFRKAIMKERKAAVKRHTEISEQSISLAEVYGELTGQIRDLRKDLTLESKQISGLRKEMSDNIGHLDSIRKAFSGYFETTRRRLDVFESRLEVVEKTNQQVITIGKGMAARIRGKKDGTE